MRTHRWIDNSNVLYQNRRSCPVNICRGYCTQRGAALETQKVKVNSQERYTLKMASKHTNENVFFQMWQYMLSTSVCLHYFYLDNYTGIWLPNIEPALIYQLIYTVHSLYTCWIAIFFQISTTYLIVLIWNISVSLYATLRASAFYIAAAKIWLSSVLKKYSYRPLKIQDILPKIAFSC